MGERQSPASSSVMEPRYSPSELDVLIVDLNVLIDDSRLLQIYRLSLANSLLLTLDLYLQKISIRIHREKERKREEKEEGRKKKKKKKERKKKEEDEEGEEEGEEEEGRRRKKKKRERG